MKPFWIKTDHQLRLAIVPRPRGGDWLEDEARALRSAGIDILVSMLPAEEAAELGLTLEAQACAAAGIRFLFLSDYRSTSAHIRRKHPRIR